MKNTLRILLLALTAFMAAAVPAQSPMGHYKLKTKPDVFTMTVVPVPGSNHFVAEVYLNGDAIEWSYWVPTAVPNRYMARSSKGNWMQVDIDNAGDLTLKVLEGPPQGKVTEWEKQP